ncbi:helix-turn-helix transcriptional regulator [Clostridium vincentii]|uniref:Helix-turn-helix protein n=1 Tax=Clostridium vincentii TaxID=52704 RepID=A0A2T0BEA7_9CLOT|nr:helix-turn-helix transcriptional regulator [Clostridium vincentii]PRR82173.1 helix-turn-helix protein [Clostridium vincentii]
MSDILYKNNQKVIGSIIKLNRIKQNMSQKELAKGTCVPSYLSRIESGDLIPSEDVISIILNRLGLVFNDSPEFIGSGTEALALFFNNLNFNEFDSTTKLFKELEDKENDFITSPLIIDYFLAKLARYSTTPKREKFEGSKNALLSAFELLSPKQKFLYNFYIGIDILNHLGDITTGKEYIKNALNFKETGHCYYWLSYSYRIENNTIKAYDCIKKALDLYVIEGNFISIMNCYEKIAEVYFMLDNYTDAIHHLKMSLRMSEKIKNSHYIDHIDSMLAWSYYRLKDYKTSLDYLNMNSGIADHRMIIPDSVLESLIYFDLKDKENLKKSILKLTSPQSLEQISDELANIFHKFFTFYLENDNYMKSHIWEGLLIYIIESLSRFVELKKVFVSLLKDYYINNRRYKDALFSQNICK